MGNLDFYNCWVATLYQIVNVQVVYDLCFALYLRDFLSYTCRAATLNRSASCLWFVSGFMHFKLELTSWWKYKTKE